MSTETRVMAPKPKIGMRPPTSSLPPQPEPEPEKPAGKGKRLPSLIIGLLIVVGAAAAYWFLAGPGAASDADAAEAAVEHVELGDVQILEPISLNLSGGHYLRIGLGLQLPADAHGEVDTAKALDAAISLFSGHSQTDLADAAVREELKTELAHTLEELYEGEVVGVYYTDFVTQ
ncbi:flagellar basal body-associated FliL family protein [Demequina gelatinilytica]|uniref:flagellar basal body-associated FliL family protein n=1 Tax=Demequina gelatinilytica TaxID=1638980 RepID=UPI0007864301|nr:flagellar basal body-associated FliL family protein [Demequina gelatinilytica]